MNYTTICTYLQGFIGISIVGSTIVLIAVGTDKNSPLLDRALLAGLGMWGMWFTWLAFNGQHDSPPALAFGSCVAFVSVFKIKQLKNLLVGEPWWPKRVKQVRAERT